MEKGYSKKCTDLLTYLDKLTGKCVPCATRAGYAVTPNCGFDDDHGRHEVPWKPCPNKTFNNSNSSAVCKPCTDCLPGYKVKSNCTSTSDTQCVSSVAPSTDASPTTSQGPTLMPRTTSLTTVHTEPPRLNQLSAVLLASGVSILVLFACVSFIMRMKGKRNLRIRYRNRPSIVKEGFSPLFSADGNNDLEQILSPGIMSAPLQTVLDNLDVLEQLVILLDPESHGVKNTKHLASHCSFPSTWIAYTYSMKESKSPLQAVLEGVTTRHPDWTVGHLAKLLRLIERNDAVIVLASLQQTL